MKYRPIIIDHKGKLRVEESPNGRWRLAEERECWYCGKDFIHPIHEGLGAYCTRACSIKAEIKRRKRRQVTKRCVICFAFFKRPRGHAERYKTCGKPSCTFKRRQQVTTARHKVEGGHFGKKYENQTK